MAASTRPTRPRRWASSPKRSGLGFHLDGARFANAVARLGCSPADLTWRAGVDALSFGFVKNGGLSAECLIFFDRELAAATHYRRKRAGHLLSKGRYLAAQILAMLEDDLWLRNARAANAAATRLAEAAGRGAAAAAGRGERGLHPRLGRRGGGAPRAGLRLLRLGPGRGAAGDRAGTAIPAMSTRSPRRSARCEQGRRLSRPEDPPPLPPDHPDLELDLDRHQGPARHRPAGLVGQLPLPDRRRGDAGDRAADRRLARASAGATGWPLCSACSSSCSTIISSMRPSSTSPPGWPRSCSPCWSCPMRRSRGCSSAQKVSARFLARVGGGDGGRRPALRPGDPRQPDADRAGARGARPHPARRARRLRLQCHAAGRRHEVAAGRADARLGDALRRACSTPPSPGRRRARR